MNILVTGGAGYLGSVLLPKLLRRNHKIRVLDIGYFGLGHIKFLLPQLDFIREDIRRIYKDSRFRKDIVQDCDCIIHLAAISNDPSCELSPKLTQEVNIKATEALAEIAKRKNIKFLFSSSCSVYGKVDGLAKESSHLNPLTLYAVSKVKCEELLNSLSNDNWRPVILRNGTLFGYSSRMRFDLVANIFSLYSTLYNEIKVFGKGEEWRPFLHVSDCAKAFIYFAEKKELKYNCYNIAYKNMQIKELADIFKELKPSINIIHTKDINIDKRDYRVSIERMNEEGFLPQIDIKTGAEEMMEAIISGLIPDPESIYYRNAKWLKELTHLGKKDYKEILDLMENIKRIHSI
ncbi:MAG: SDR family oxidoreductase [Candidatus Omnitrophica bacterium]|nr:SDR family oxidoreductase [Candidatus Omnitrophota bacterium]